jgi:DNA-binding transcriptional MerR regulator
MNPVKYSIRDLERLSGIKAHTIRIWEKRYGIIQPERTSTNIRYYSDSNLQKLLNISLLNKNGYKISHISEMTDDEILTEVEKLSEDDTMVDSDMNTLILAAIEMDEEEVEKTINSSILKIGFERTFCDLIFPLFLKVNILWQIGRISACQERFLSNMVRQKLLVAIDGLLGQTLPEHQHFLMFMPSGEFNEIGLLFANYLVRKQGHEVTYLGPSITLEHLGGLNKKDKYDDVLLNITLPNSEEDHHKYVKSLLAIFPGKTIHIILSGEQPDSLTMDHDGISYYKSFNEFSSFLAVS